GILGERVAEQRLGARELARVAIGDSEVGRARRRRREGARPLERLDRLGRPLALELDEPEAPPRGAVVGLERGGHLVGARGLGELALALEGEAVAHARLRIGRRDLDRLRRRGARLRELLALARTDREVDPAVGIARLRLGGALERADRL